MSIRIDSREVRSGDVFFSLVNDQKTAELHIKQALNNGASEIYSRFHIENSIFCEDIWLEMMTHIRKEYSDLPTKIMAITGTNGKTSTAYFVWQLLRKIGKNCIYIGTIGIYIDKYNNLDENFSHLKTKNMSTLDITTMYEVLNIAKVKYNCDFAVIEATSHALDQNRLDGLKLESGGFTNLSQDHLDYHKTFENYFDAKKKLFLRPENIKIVTNIDDEYGVEISKIKPENTITYGKGTSDLQIKSISQDDGAQNVEFTYKGDVYKFNTFIASDFQIYNIMCAIGLCLANSFKIDEIVAKIPEISAPIGRLERVIFQGKPTNIYVDYAHTPDALENALNELRKACKKKLFCVFGCGGNRDAEKRKIMGKIAVNIANTTIITDDNPRNEDPEYIRSEIIAGIVEDKNEKMKNLHKLPSKKIMTYGIDSPDFIGNFVEISPRDEAVKYAVNNAQDGDYILIAGKGHETYQVIGEKIYHFSDIEEATKALELK